MGPYMLTPFVLPACSYRELSIRGHPWIHDKLGLVKMVNHAGMKNMEMPVFTTYWKLAFYKNAWVIFSNGVKCTFGTFDALLLR